MNELFAPLREQTPTDDEIAAVLAARPRSRRRGRAAVGLVTATAAAAVAVAALPGAGGREASPLTPPGMLRAAAAVAADQPGPPAFSGYRYTELIEFFRWDGPHGGMPHQVEQRLENWVDRGWQGRVVAHPGKVISGEPPDHWVKPDVRPYAYGDGPLHDLDISALPTEPQGLRQALQADFLRDFDPGYEPNASALAYHVTRSVLLLLSTANTTPSLRAALWGVLALTPDLEASSARDPRGREGEAVRFRLTRMPGGPPDRFTVIFDPETSELLSWSIDGEANGLGTPDQSTVLIRAAHVRDLGERP